MRSIFAQFASFSMVLHLAFGCCFHHSRDAACANSEVLECSSTVDCCDSHGVAESLQANQTIRAQSCENGHECSYQYRESFGCGCKHPTQNACPPFGCECEQCVCLPGFLARGSAANRETSGSTKRQIGCLEKSKDDHRFGERMATLRRTYDQARQGRHTYLLIGVLLI